MLVSDRRAAACVAGPGREMRRVEDRGKRGSVPRRIALLALAAPRRVIAVALLVFLGAVGFGSSVA